MSQHDYNIANAPGATVRADINALAGAIGSLNGGTTAPTVTFPHMLWYDETNNVVKLRNTANTAWMIFAGLIDTDPTFAANSDANVPSQKAVATAIASAVPSGSIFDYAGTTAPIGYLMCFGQSLLRTSYPALFTAIGTTFGSVDGTHFTLPDVRGRARAGVDNMGGTAANRLTAATMSSAGLLAATGGEEKHLLLTAEMPSHSHTATVTDPGHVHDMTIRSATNFGTGQTPQSAMGGNPPNLTNTNPTNSNTTGITVGNANTGGGGSHNNVQPTIAFNVIIKT